MAKSPFRSFGKTVYPSPSARHGERIGVSPIRRCQMCGAPNDTRKAATAAAGDGLQVIVGVAPKTDDTKVTGGCSNCGSLNWNPHKRALPDDRFKRTPGLRRKKWNGRWGT